MTLVDLFKILAMMESSIGNHVSISIRKFEEYSLKFTLVWPDGFVMSHICVVSELERLEEEIFVLYLVKKAKDGHPKLASTIS